MPIVQDSSSVWPNAGSLKSSAVAISVRNYCTSGNYDLLGEYLKLNAEFLKVRVDEERLKYELKNAQTMNLKHEGLLNARGAVESFQRKMNRKFQLHKFPSVEAKQRQPLTFFSRRDFFHIVYDNDADFQELIRKCTAKSVEHKNHFIEMNCRDCQIDGENIGAVGVGLYQNLSEPFHRQIEPGAIVLNIYKEEVERLDDKQFCLLLILCEYMNVHFSIGFDSSVEEAKSNVENKL